MKVAFGSVPKDGGTFTFYRNLRPALRQHGIELLCVTVGRKEAKLVEKTYVDDGCVILAADTDNIKQQAKVFVAWCEQVSIDSVMAINSVAILSALPHLPKRIRVLSRCANGFDEGYRITLSGQARLMAIVALTPRLRGDLVEKYNADAQLIHLIPNGLDPAPFDSASARIRGLPDDRPIQLGFMGRLEHNQKGVMYLPEIVRVLKQLGVSFHLRIAGKGVHAPLLERALKPDIDRGNVEMIGAISKHEIPSFLEATDVFLFTSHFEGCPNALLEAMMAGCVPVALLIEGITDFLIENGKTGFVAPMADCSAFAQHIARLASDRAMLRRVGVAAATEARSRLTANGAAKSYADLLWSIRHSPLPDYEPLSWSQFRVDPVYRKRLSSYLPEAIKKPIKSAMKSAAIANYLQRF